VVRGRRHEEHSMTTRAPGLLAVFFIPVLVAMSLIPARAESPSQVALENGVVKVKSAFPIAETIERIKRDVAAKGIMLFTSIDQSKLAADVGIELHPSTLLIFGNPALGSQFITSNPLAAIDWPVRLVVTQDEEGEVWAVYNDFGYIARRHGISDRKEAFEKASEVIGSIASSVAR
jgi:uncharacterized protein (DUF302 family)